MLSYQNYLGKLLEYSIQGLVINRITGESPTVLGEERFLQISNLQFFY
ncbi:hypothetical protein [Paenibacillus eucommiae]|uniref:Uncharacterized protein n=1 Tax=Paenibacillus eucommiae TaxID=1355755 RepID=A0ABS4J6E5_9BACL|nr:hypothetical protein [Paenibacillus eucommiae]MBP1995370.1 hypothetical protein [Paenibacillus eucommiae]